MIETLVYRYSSDSSQQELSNEIPKGLDDFQTSLRPCALDESSLSIGRVNSETVLSECCDIFRNSLGTDI